MAVRPHWNRQLVLGAIRAWVGLYGAPPVAADWNPAQARARGNTEQVRRYYQAESSWPNHKTVLSYFSSWNAAVQAAGFTPRSHCVTEEISVQAQEALAALSELESACVESERTDVTSVSTNTNLVCVDTVESKHSLKPTKV